MNMVPGFMKVMLIYSPPLDGADLKSVRTTLTIGMGKGLSLRDGDFIIVSSFEILYAVW